MNMNNTPRNEPSFSQVPQQDIQEEIPLHQRNRYSSVTTSGDIQSSQKHPRRLRWNCLGWTWDIVCWFLSLLCFLGIVIVFIYFHNRELPKWPWSITVNTIISILTTLGSLLLAVPITSALGQTKWLRLNERTNLDDFVKVDNSTRSPWGSFVLLARRRGGTLASIGAILTLILLAIPPFIQAAVTFPTIYNDVGGATIPIARHLQVGTSTLYFDKLDQSSSGMESALMRGLYSGLYSIPGSHFPVTATCPTNNCTWPPYETLAMCSSCLDITSHLTTTLNSNPNVTYPPLSSHYLLPNGFGLQLNVESAGIELNVSGVYELNPIAFPDKPSPPVVNMFVVAAWPTPQKAESVEQVPTRPPIAWECRLQYCIQSLKAQFINGKLNETVIGTQLIHVLPNPSQVTTFTSHTNNTKYDIYDATTLVLATWLGRDIFSGTVQGRLNNLFTDEPWDLVPSSNSMQAIMQAINSTTLPQLMNGVAESLTLALRTLPYQPPAHQGASYTPVNIVSVNWPWMILPLVSLLGGLVFLGAVISRGNGNVAGVWKNSTLPIIFRSERIADGQGYESLETVESMEDVARKVNIQMNQEGRVMFIS